MKPAQTQYLFKRWLQSLSLIICLALLFTGCASGPKVVDHAFGFDARVDSPNMLVLDFRYGEFAQNRNMFRGELPTPQNTNNNGPMPLGDTLYVKWRNKLTAQEFEDTVNLKPLLPLSMERKRIYFVVQGPQLYIYLIDPVPRPADWPQIGPRKFQYEKVRQIYPAHLPK